MKIQLDATEYSPIYFTAKLLYMFRVSLHSSSGVLKTLTAVSGTCHNIGTTTSLQRGQIVPIWPRRKDIMTCTGGCGYSF